MVKGNVKIKVTVGFSGTWGAYHLAAGPEDEIEVPAEVAKDLMAKGWAESLAGPATKVKKEPKTASKRGKSTKTK